MKHAIKFYLLRLIKLGEMIYTIIMNIFSTVLEFDRSFRIAFSTLVTLFFLGGCAHSPDTQLESSQWMRDVINYQHTLKPNHPDSAEVMLRVSDRMRAELKSQFGESITVTKIMEKYKLAQDLAQWLISENGHNMRYDVNASFNPVDAYSQKAGNCLSFTLLLHVLAAEMNIDIQFNEVDIPYTWGMNENDGMVFYRHVNGIMKAKVRSHMATTEARSQVFDLALDQYEFGYPQRIISREAALAQLHSNRAVKFLQEERHILAYHLIRLAVSLSPDNADLWVNLGVILKSLNQRDRAEQAFLKGHELDVRNVPAVTNLERFYIEEGQAAMAKKYNAAADRARKSNPYYHYEMAKINYQKRLYRKAMTDMKKAIRLYDLDPKFFELQSHIAQQLGEYELALEELTHARNLSRTEFDQERYSKKMRSVSKKTSIFQ